MAVRLQWFSLYMAVHITMSIDKHEPLVVVANESKIKDLFVLVPCSTRLAPNSVGASGSASVRQCT